MLLRPEHVYVNQIFLATYSLSFPRAYYGASACRSCYLFCLSHTVRHCVIAQGLKIQGLGGLMGNRFGHRLLASLKFAEGQSRNDC